MDQKIDTQQFTTALFDLMSETFEAPQGIYLDKNTSLFETLETISAEEASIPVGGKCATLGAQVTHVIFYLEVLERYMLRQDAGKVDWGEIWRTVREVTPESWQGLKSKLRETYERVFAMMRGVDSWNDEQRLGGALAIVVHTAYHLGEIRQALCTLK